MFNVSNNTNAMTTKKKRRILGWTLAALLMLDFVVRQLFDCGNLIPVLKSNLSIVFVCLIAMFCFEAWLLVKNHKRLETKAVRGWIVALLLLLALTVVTLCCAISDIIS